MALKKHNPYTPATRFKVMTSREELSKEAPTRSLIKTKKRTGGRNNTGDRKSVV